MSLPEDRHSGDFVDRGEFDELAQRAGVHECRARDLPQLPEAVVRVDRTIPRRTSSAASAPSSSYLDAIPKRITSEDARAARPVAQDIPEYAEYLGAIEREARRVNDRFQQSGGGRSTLQIADNFPQSVAAYKQFDVLLVNAIFDRMNLVAKEAPLVKRA